MYEDYSLVNTVTYNVLHPKKQVEDPAIYLRQACKELSSQNRLPKTIAVICDGNRRWAQRLGLEDNAGHIAGLSKIQEIIDWSLDYNIKNIVFYLLSVENIKKRSKDEISFLWSQFLANIRYDLYSDKFKDKNIIIKHIGKRDHIPSDVLSYLDDLIEQTSNNTGLTVTEAIAYTGSEEILSATKKIIENVNNGGSFESYDDFLKELDLKDTIDLLIRPGKEQRISGFLPVQSQYAELAFFPKLLPDITETDYLNILINYADRERRFGGNSSDGQYPSYYDNQVPLVSEMAYNTSLAIREIINHVRSEFIFSLYRTLDDYVRHSYI